MSMKVVQINAVYQYSSTGKLTEEMHEYMLSKGVQSYVFCTNWNDPSKGIFKIGNKFDYKLHGLFSRIFGKQGYFSTIPTSRLIKKLNDIEPDVVVLGNLHGNYINLPKLLQYLGNNNVPTLLILHDCWFFTGHCCYYVEDNCDKWKSECNRCPAFKKYNKSLFFDTSTKLFYDKKKLFSSIKNLTIVGVSEWIKNEAKESVVLSNASRFERIYNWLNLDLFKPKDASLIRDELGIKKDDFVIIGVSQIWNEYKGFGRFIRLAESRPNYKIYLVGRVPEKTKLPSNLVSLGEINNPERLALLYNMADVFLNFSIQETFGKVSAEAVACGTPIITNTITANPELCGEGCGKIVDITNWESVLEAVDILSTEGKVAYTTSCVQFARDNFEKSGRLNDYFQLIKDIINK